MEILLLIVGLALGAVSVWLVMRDRLGRLETAARGPRRASR